MLIRKMVGISIFFLGVVFWGIIVVALLIGGLPLVAIAFCVGWLTHTRPWPRLKEYAVWGWVRKHVFNFRVFGEENVPDKRERLIWAIYPHGHFALAGIFYWALNPEFSKARAAVHSVLFYIPIMSSFVNWIGAIGVTEAEMTDELLTNDGEIFMYPGGVADMSYEGNDYKRRRGFLRVARETHSTIMPVWCPDERSYYTQWLPFGRHLEWALGFPVPMFIFGRWWCPLLPKSVPDSRILIGKPIAWDSLTQEQDFEDEIKRLQSLI